MFYQKSKFEPKSHTTVPDYVGNSVIGIKYNNGVLIGTDTRLCYGGLAKYQNINNRISRINDNTIMGSSGEYSDYQEVTRILEEETQKDSLNSRSYLGPSEVTNYLSSIHYYRRNKMDPYLNSHVVGGVDWSGKTVLNMVDQYGTKLSGDYFVTGMGAYFSSPIIEPELARNIVNINRTAAIDVLEKCFKVIYYRDARAGNNIKYSWLEKEGETLVYDEMERSFKGNWGFSQFKTITNDLYK